MGPSEEALSGGGPRSRELLETFDEWQRVEGLWRTSPLAAIGIDGLALSLLSDLQQLVGRLPLAAVVTGLFEATARLLTLEEIGEVEPVWPDIETDVSAAVAFRQLTARRKRWCADFDRLHLLLRRHLLPVLRVVVTSLPGQCFEEGDEGAAGWLDIPLIDVLERPTAVIEGITVFAFSDDAVHADLFAAFRRTMRRNLLAASGFQPSADWAKHRDRVIFPTQQRGKSAQELVDLYLRGTPFEAVLSLPVPFRIPAEVRFEHCHIVGGTGHGKTQLLQQMIYRDLVAATKERRAVVVIDSQGDLITKLTRLALFDPGDPEGLADRLVVIDPADVEFPASLNLFDAHLERVQAYGPADRERVLNGVIELYEIFFGDMLGAELTQKQGVVFRYLARLMITIPGATIHTLMQLMEDGRPFRAQMEQLDGSARYFFQTEFFHPSFAATRKQILRRLWGVLSTPAFERMFAQPVNKLDLFEALNDGKIILISTAKELLKADGSALFGRLFIAMLAQAALERSILAPADRTPASVYVDEAQEYFDDSVETILNQARKYNVGLTLAHQTLDQLSPRLRSAILANTSLKCVGGVSAKDARALADELRTSADFVESMRRRGNQTEFAVWLKNTTPHAIRMTVPLGFLEREPTLAEEDFDALMDANRARYCGTLADVPALRSIAWEPGPPIPDDNPEPVGPAPSYPRTPPPEPSVPPATRSAEPRDLGKGGPKHRYLQNLVKELGEQQGFRATIEAPLAAGGQVDVLLERDGLTVAVEVSVSTPVQWEIENVRKCLGAGHAHVAVLSAKSRVAQARYRQAISEALTEDQRPRFSLLAPEDMPDFIGGLAPAPESTESLVRGYRVRVSQTSTSVEDAAARRAAITRLVAKSLREKPG